ncbi:hypothetical protein B0J11DRAFT_580188 [Dendryphion nanum]|uniref:Uncharacterized protein n=1 Tax=Dendryphion nanum TaxID=256645 RepID=A0A9P9DTD0_9PLEO|nr:hypothetical protein B0J11DRAFT_580188 [Dendryphion nanum]
MRIKRAPPSPILSAITATYSQPSAVKFVTDPSTIVLLLDFNASGPPSRHNVDSQEDQQNRALRQELENAKAYIDALIAADDAIVKKRSKPKKTVRFALDLFPERQASAGGQEDPFPAPSMPVTVPAVCLRRSARNIATPTMADDKKNSVAGNGKKSKTVQAPNPSTQVEGHGQEDGHEIPEPASRRKRKREAGDSEGRERNNRQRIGTRGERLRHGNEWELEGDKGNEEEELDVYDFLRACRGIKGDIEL